MKKYSVIFYLLVLSCFTYGQTDSLQPTNFLDSMHTSQVNIVFAGDIMGHGPQFRAAFDSTLNSYNYEPCFRYIEPYISSADIALANLELTFGGKPYTGYPTFSSPDALCGAIKKAGFDMLAMANNHCYDKGKYGFERTMAVVDSSGLKRLGTYAKAIDKKNNYPLLVNVNGIHIAFLNYTWGTNGIEPQAPNIVNYIDKQLIANDARAADSLGADFTVAVMHWGIEYQETPNQDQKDLARFMASKGIDAIIGSHPHVVQTFEILYPNAADSSVGVPVFYSMGNFISNQRDPNRDGGAMFHLSITKTRNKISCTTCTYLPYWVYRGTIKGKYQYYVIPIGLYLKTAESFSFSSEDDARIREFGKHAEKQFPNLLKSDF